MLIAQISDLHISANGSKTYGVAPMAENLKRCIEHIHALNPRPDVVIVSGDISASGLTKELCDAKRLLDTLTIPYFVIFGNHDIRDDRLNLAACFSEQNCPIDKISQKYVHYVLDDYPLRLIAVDSTRYDHPGGELCDRRLKWLDTQLAKDTNKPTVIFMHHPPLKLSISESNIDGFIGAEKLGEIIKKYTNIERILCGHVHLTTFARWNGTLVSTVASLGMKLQLDLTMKEPSQFLLEEPRYQLHHWTPEKNLISHTIKVSSNTKTYFFD